MSNPDEEPNLRFRVSDTGVAVDLENLKTVNINDTYDCMDDTTGNSGFTLTTKDQTAEPFSYDFQYSPFRFRLYSNGVILLEVNNEDTLFFESNPADNYNQSVSMGFFMGA